MQRGVAVVRYSCDGIEVLRACSAPGDYRYSPVSLKEKVVQMDDQAAIRANFGTGISFVKGIEAEIAAGRSLQLAYMLAGIRATTVPRVATSELEGRCDGATHFVYDVSVGAVAMDTAARGEALAAADLFGRGASVSGGSKKSVAQRDGDPASCEQTDSLKSSCAAPLRVSLFAIDAAQARGPASTARRDARSCPQGFVWSDGACVEASSADAFLCTEGDLEECVAQCQAGSHGSCGRAAVTFNRVLVDPEAGRDAKQATLDEMESLAPNLQAACETGGEGPACTAVAYVRFRNLTGPEKEENQAKGIALSEQGCLLGEAQACRMIRRAYLTSSGKFVGVDLNPQRFMSILQRGCARGSALPCQFLAESYAMGAQVDRDLDAARSYARRACRGELAEACLLAAGLESGGATCKHLLGAYGGLMPKDAATRERQKLHQQCGAAASDAELGAKLRRSACELGAEAACGEAKDP